MLFKMADEISKNIIPIRLLNWTGAYMILQEYSWMTSQIQISKL